LKYKREETRGGGGRGGGGRGGILEEEDLPGRWEIKIK